MSFVALVVSGITGVTLAFLGYAYWGIAIQSLTYCLCMTVTAWYFSGWRPTLHIDFSPLKGMLWFSSKLLITNIFTHINNNLFSLFFGRLYGEKMVGYYNQANKWTGMGYTTLTGMLWSVVQPVFARLADDSRERQCRAFRKMLRFTAFLSYPALFGLALIAPEFIVIAITDKWLPAARLMQVLCVGGAFMPVASVFSNFVIGRGRSDVYMWSTIALCLLQTLLLVLLHPYGVEAMVWAYVALNTLWIGVWYRYVRGMTGLKFRELLKDLLPFACSLRRRYAVAARWPWHLPQARFPRFASRLPSRPASTSARCGCSKRLSYGKVWNTFCIRRNRSPRALIAIA